MKSIFLAAMLAVISLVLAAACSAGAQESASTKGSMNPAMVDAVQVDTVNGHEYAVISGFYPDPCTRISEVDQAVQGSRFVISLSTDSPPEILCAQMLEAFEISILLETGGLPAGEYIVQVNDLEASFSLGQ